MPSLRDIRGRIEGVQKTQKIVSAMKMVAAAKLARAQAAIQAARPYAEKLAQVLGSVAAGVSADAHPLLQPRNSVRRLDLVVFTSDRGLCGAFNANVVKYARALIAERADGGPEVSLVTIGRRGRDALRKTGLPIARDWVDLTAITPAAAAEIANYLTARFRGGEADEALLVYGTFRSALTQIPTDAPLLPVRPPRDADPDAAGAYTIEPDPESLLAELIPSAVEFSVFRALLENAASEHGARMTAMDSATNNTEELIRTLTLDFNKARQASITAELVEIVSGAEAL